MAVLRESSRRDSWSLWYWDQAHNPTCRIRALVHVAGPERAGQA